MTTPFTVAVQKNEQGYWTLVLGEEFWAMTFEKQKATLTYEILHVNWAKMNDKEGK